MSHDSGETFVHASQDCYETVVRLSRECLMTLCASHDSRETCARVSHNIRANFNQFYFVAIKSRTSLINVAVYSHICGIVQIEEIKLRCVCEGLDTSSRRIHDTCDHLAIVLRLFLSHKKVLHV